MATNLPFCFYSCFRTTLEVSSILYFVEICYVSEKLWLFNHKRADFWLPNFGFKRSLFSLLNSKRHTPFTVKTVHACPPNFEVSCPTFECRMRRFGNRSQRFAPNVPTFRQNVRANLSSFIQDLFWRVRFSNENFKIVELEVFKRRFQDGRGRPC